MAGYSPDGRLYKVRDTSDHKVYYTTSVVWVRGRMGYGVTKDNPKGLELSREALQALHTLYIPLIQIPTGTCVLRMWPVGE